MPIASLKHDTHHNIYHYDDEPPYPVFLTFISLVHTTLSRRHTLVVWAKMVTILQILPENIWTSKFFCSKPRLANIQTVALHFKTEPVSNNSSLTNKSCTKSCRVKDAPTLAHFHVNVDVVVTPLKLNEFCVTEPCLYILVMLRERCWNQKFLFYS